MLPEELKQYEKQISLNEIGIKGQNRLKEGRILVVGAGGLGCPALIQLAGSGVGIIGIVDGDNVEISNLPRQPLYKPTDIGRNKAQVAASQLNLLNPLISTIAYPNFLDKENAHLLLPHYDIIIDATDQPAPRYEISNYCENHGPAHIYGAVEGMVGQIAVFNVYDKKHRSYSYKDLFPEPSPSSCQCSEAGILGMVPNSIGMLQALEAIKLLLGQRSPLQSHLLTINYETYKQQQIALCHNPRPNSGYQLKAPSAIPEVSMQKLNRLLLSHIPPLLIDVRNKTEPKEEHLGGLWIPLDTLEKKAPLLPKNRPIIVYCKTGRRSKKAAHMLKNLYPEICISCLKQD